MRLHIKVKPAAKKDELTKEPDGAILVRIKAPPVDGKANKYLIPYLASFFDLPPSRIKLLKGKTNKFKTIEIDAEDEYIQKKLEML